jgi:PAS domain S-box-containing protein
MSVKKKILIIVGLAFCCLMTVVYISTYAYIRRSALQQENNLTQQNVTRVISSIEDDLDNLSVQTTDWAHWDDTYVFALNGNQEYIQSNMAADTFDTLRLNLMAYVDTTGKITFAKAYDLPAHRFVDFSADAASYLANVKFLNSVAAQDGVQGFIDLPNGVMLISAEQILKSDLSGPGQGALVMGRLLTGEETQRISLITHLNVSVRSLDDAQLPLDFQQALLSLSSGQSIMIQPLDEDTVAGYALLNDINGNPALILKITQPRDIYKATMADLPYYALTLVLALSVFSLLAYFILEKFVLSRLDNLSKNVNDIAKAYDPNRRIFIEGNDELSLLAREINGMIEALEASHSALHESEEKYRLLVERANEGIAIIQGQTLTYANPRLTQLLGRPMEELKDAAFPQFLSIERREAAIKTLERIEAKEEPAGFSEIDLLHKNGQSITVELSFAGLIYEGKSAVLVIIHDISDRKRAENRQAEEKERLDVTLRSIADGVITTDIDGRIVLMNKVAEKLTGLELPKAMGQMLAEVFICHDLKKESRRENTAMTALETGLLVNPAELSTLTGKDGKEHIISQSAAPIHDRESKVIGAVLVFRDMTEAQKLEEELLKARQLESIGILAGGIAHDFNNMLTAILGNISLAKIQANNNKDLGRVLAEAEKASLRAKELTNQLLTFAKGGSPIKKLTSVADIIQDSAIFALRGSNVSCEFHFDDRLWPIQADEGQISQVINNMVINAIQAMLEGGKITISAINLPLIENGYALPLAKGDYIQIQIKDAGVGIPSKYLSKIFDPYFSTKEKGSGLGLATAYSIIKRHNGHIEVTSELGKGTTFKIYLPASPSSAYKKQYQNIYVKPGKGKILVMDDEEPVREVVSQMLKDIGYEVEFANDGSELIFHYVQARNSGQPFDAVIMDLTIPGGMGGKEAISKLMEIDPKAKAIVSSGYATDPIIAQYEAYGFCGAVPKPYRIQDLSEALADLIDGKGH